MKSMQYDRSISTWAVITNPKNERDESSPSKSPYSKLGTWVQAKMSQSKQSQWECTSIMYPWSIKCSIPIILQTFDICDENHKCKTSYNMRGNRTYFECKVLIFIYKWCHVVNYLVNCLFLPFTFLSAIFLFDIKWTHRSLLIITYFFKILILT